MCRMLGMLGGFQIFVWPGHRPLRLNRVATMIRNLSRAQEVL
jgi:hypothetical protein